MSKRTIAFLGLLCALPVGVSRAALPPAQAASAPEPVAPPILQTPPPIAGSPTDELLSHRPAPPPEPTKPPVPHGPWLTAPGDCRGYLRDGHFRRAALCAGKRDPLTLAQAAEALGNFDLAGTAWRAARGQTTGAMSVEVMHRANALAELEAAVAAMVAAKRRPARKHAESAMQTIARQAKLGSAFGMARSPALELAYGLAMRFSGRHRQANNAFASAARGRGWAADRARQYAARMRSRAGRKGPWPLVERAYGGPGEDVVNAAAATDGGDLLLAGRASVPGAEDAQMAIWRIDSSGRLRWQQTFGGEGHDEAAALVEIAPGEIIVVGETDGDGGKRDILAVRFDRARNVAWHHALGGPGHDRAVAAIGRPEQQVWAAAVTDAGTPQADMRLLVLSADGNQRNLIRIKAIGEDRATALATLGAGAVMVGAGRDRDGDPWSGRLVAFDARAEIFWQHRLVAGDGCSIEALTVDAKRSFYVAARSWTGGRSPGLLVVRFDSGGRKRWQVLDKRLMDVEIGGIALTGRNHLAVLAKGHRPDTFARTWLLGFRGQRPKWTTPLGGDAISHVTALLPVGRYGLVALGSVDDRGAGYRDGWYMRTDR